MEQRHDWAKMTFTFELFKYVLTELIPEVIVHSKSQDEEQVRGHYDRQFPSIRRFLTTLTLSKVVMTFMNGFFFFFFFAKALATHRTGCNRFLGPRMVYTSGIVLDLDTTESLEQLQDNKLAVVCEKLGLQPKDRLLDVGCGWGTLAAFAAKNYGCHVTGITLGKNQTKFGNQRIQNNGISPDEARILCMDYRDIPGGPGHYTKIVSLEMAEVIQISKAILPQRLIDSLTACRNPTIWCFYASDV
jgi:sphingolipid C9-methyltransferase